MPDMPKHLYVLPPMKIGWEQLPTVAEYLKTIVGRSHGPVPRELRSFLDFYDACLALALSRDWKGTFRSGYEPRVIALPAAPLPRLALAWRCGEEERTYVASEVPMSWLGEQ